MFEPCPLCRFVNPPKETNQIKAWFHCRNCGKIYEFDKRNKTKEEVSNLGEPPIFRGDQANA